ncbi:MAG: HEPN domain-containing protein [bacterium]
MENYRKELAFYRLEKAKEHLSSASDLFHSNHLIDSISRSYYAIFTAARAILALKELDSSKHSGVISFFNQYIIKTGILDVELSKIIQEAKNYREKADYADYFVIEREVAKKQLENARVFIDKTEKKIQMLCRDDELKEKAQSG